MNGLPYPNSVYNQFWWDGLEGSGTLVGWWDFTDIDQLYQTRSSYDTAVSSDGDKIGRCKNKANPLLGLDGSTMDGSYGVFMKADQSNDRPTYKTGGANGHSYALFDGSGTGLACRSESTDWGAHSTDILSSWPVFATFLDIWIIGEPVDNDSDGVKETALSYFGYRGTATSYADAGQSSLFTFSREDDEDTEAKWILTTGGTITPPVSPNFVTATQSFSHWNSGETTIINIACRTGLGASNIYTNNVPDVGQTVFDTNSDIAEEFRQENLAVMDNTFWDDTKVASWGIGAQLNSAGQLTANYFEGKIYEVLVYVLDIPNDTERSAIASYFVNKYSV